MLLRTITIDGGAYTQQSALDFMRTYQYYIREKLRDESAGASGEIGKAYELYQYYKNIYNRF